MALKQDARPSRKKARLENQSESYCGLDSNDVEDILKVVGDENLYLSSDEEEPFVEAEANIYHPVVRRVNKNLTKYQKQN